MDRKTRIRKSKLPYNFAHIKHRGTVNSAVTNEGYEVKREEKVYVEKFGRWIQCISTDNHFVYLDPCKKLGRWFAMCTCGAPAVIVGYNAYKHGASPSSNGDTPGELLVCYYHIQYGKHADGSS